MHDAAAEQQQQQQPLGRISVFYSSCSSSPPSPRISVSLFFSRAAALCAPFSRRSIFQAPSIILTLVDYTRAGGILPWRRGVAASLKFHTR